MFIEASKHQETLRHFCSKYPLRYLKKDRPLYYQGEIPRSVFFIETGVVKYYNITGSGEEKIVGYESSGEFLPLEWLFGNAPAALYYYDTFTDSKLYSVPKNDLIKFLESDHQASLALMNRMATLYIGKTIHLHALEQSRARDKLLYILQYLVLRFGEPAGQNLSSINLRLTHQDIANLLGLTRETISTEIGKLTTEGVIKSKNSRYVVNVDKVLRQLGENDFGELTL